MYYGIYKDIRDSAWQCFDDFGIDKLPVDVLKIAKGSDVRVVKNSQVNILSGDENGKTFFDGDEWIIVYKDENPVELSRFTIAHELGHIFLGHELTLGKFAGVREFVSMPKAEKQADAFALRLLCPACVLWGIGLRSSDEIAAFCKIPHEMAEKRSKRMSTLYKRGKFLTSDRESAVFARFSLYIQDVLWKQTMDKVVIK